MIYILVTKADSRDDYKNWYYSGYGEEKLEWRVITSVCFTQKILTSFRLA